MISVLAAPIAGKVLLDANNTIITVQSDNGAGYYFRALIYVDDVLFDTQGWSRENANRAKKDLKKLYSSYFSSIFPTTIATALVEQTHLIRKINITINEYSLATDTLSATVDLPEFFFMFNQNPVAFRDADKIQFLDMQPDVMQVPLNGILNIPFFVNAANETITASILNDTTTFHTLSAANVTGRKAFLYTVDLAPLALPSTLEWFTLRLECGAEVIEKTYKIFLLPVYSIKAIAFRNNFGFFLYAYFEGDLQIVNAHKQETYLQADNTEKVFEVSEDATYTLNTATLLEDEKQIIRQICNTVDARYKNGTEWLVMVNKSKRFREYADNNHSFEEDLTFMLMKNPDIANFFYDQSGAPMIGDIPDIHFTRELDGTAFVLVAGPVITDPEGDSFTYVWSCTELGVTLTPIFFDGGMMVEMIITALAADTFDITITVTDSTGEVATKSFPVICDYESD